ncbi:MAG TPA: bifunctional diguanylate cyclase/phosphodiesterase, partial [Acidimicrobiales bacterium]|nr:bifunctional diguanylate cyclase/phosphodiesterase [Acidimicrobiales bacterium]
SHLQPLGGEHSGLWPIVALGTWAAACYKVPVRDRRAGFSISLTGIPLLLALPFLRPSVALAAFFCGRLAAQLQNRRALDKALIGSLVSVMDMALGLLFYDHVLGDHSPASHWGWLVACLTIAIVSVADLVGVLAAAALYSWKWRPPPLASALAHAGLDLLISCVGGVTAIVLVRAGTWDVAIFALLVGVGDAGWRRASLAAQRHAALHRLYTFTERLALADGGERELVATVQEGARSLLSASRAVLAVPLEAPLDELMLRCSVDGDGPVVIEEAVPRDDLAGRVASEGAFVISKPTAPRPGRRARSGRKGCPRDIVTPAVGEELGEAVVAPLRPGDPATGYVLVANRVFNREPFGPAEQELLGRVAANATVALSRGGLVDKLRHEAALRDYEARHDPLTGLPNRLLLSEHLDAALRRHGPCRLALLLIDLDGFKQVNDMLGRESGDVILREVSARLSAMADERTLVARSGGDQFALVVEDAGSEEDCLSAASAGLASLAAPVEVEGLELIVRASAGVASATGPKASAAELLRQAELAVRKAKAHGGGARAYDTSSDSSALRRLTLVGELRKAMEAESLAVHYQPMAALPSGKILGFEALARWGHEELGEVPPERFVAVAERAGLIEPLTWWVLETALAEVKAWRQVLPEVSVSVNLSAASLSRRDLGRRVAAALDVARVPPAALRLELTETSIMAEMGKRALGELRDLGIPLSIDDFGTGYSSFSRLRLLPFDEVKIDRSFVSRMCATTEDEAVVHSVIELAKGLGKTAAAEGVEDRATFERLAALRCDKAQGFYLAPPLPADECEALLWAGLTRLPVPQVGTAIAQL